VVHESPYRSEPSLAPLLTGIINDVKELWRAAGRRGWELLGPRPAPQVVMKGGIYGVVGSAH
jgi:hypothetical protein